MYGLYNRPARRKRLPIGSHYRSSDWSLLLPWRLCFAGDNLQSPSSSTASASSIFSFSWPFSSRSSSPLQRTAPSYYDAISLPLYTHGVCSEQTIGSEV